MADFKREVAHRLFAREIQDATISIPSQGEKSAAYCVSPTGAKINRIHFVGLCTSIDSIGAEGTTLRMRISDPTGFTTVYAGEFQPEAQHKMGELVPPVMVAVTGKLRHYQPEDGRILVSVRPESIQAVGEVEQRNWIVQTSRRTKERLDAMRKLGERGPEDDPRYMAKSVFPANLLQEYDIMVRESLKCLLPGQEIPVHHPAPRMDEGSDESGEAQEGNTVAWQAPKAAAKEGNAEEEALDDKIFEVLSKLDTGKGANWDDIIDQAKAFCPDVDQVDASINRLLDKGVVFEPTLGVLKRA